jgi:multidrug resistance efflux pump
MNIYGKLLIGFGGAVALSVVALVARPVSNSDAGMAESATREVIAPGSVQAVADPVALSWEASGRVAEVMVKEGERVEAGQLLARLDDRLLKAGVARSEANLGAARARRDQIVHGSRPEEIKAAEAELEAARAKERDAVRRRGQAERLLSSNSVARSDFDEAKESEASARALADAAAARLVLAQKGPREEVRRESAAAVSAAEAEHEETLALLAQTELHSPLSGVVLRRNVEVGEHVTQMPPKVVLTLVNMDRLEIRAEIDEADVGRVTLGTRGFASADAFGDRRFPGHVVRVLGELGRKALRVDDPRARVDTRILEVIFALDQAADLPLGLRMDVHLETAR